MADRQDVSARERLALLGGTPSTEAAKRKMADACWWCWRLELLELLLVMMDNSVILLIASSERGGRLHVLFQLV